ncbi:hypothetical protein [Ancylobacter oerskovii]|uniref:Uncharacterized protein n=1 Tax=Ancylobacter oerskovii TaxID=459519 RepID=A0ABW4Z194_9HYPH|nr:hypothetical protein [Ancylobacter oerskovii]MBS7542558.1 hypothetical protein [Ancylobacter oerskovii]
MERRASPIRDEDILDIAMEHFWGAEGGNKEGVAAVLAFAKPIYLDQAMEYAIALVKSFDVAGWNYEAGHDAESLRRAILKALVDRTETGPEGAPSELTDHHDGDVGHEERYLCNLLRDDRLMVEDISRAMNRIRYRSILHGRTM